MAGNPIRKLLQIVFDRASAEEANKSAQESLGPIDRSLSGLRDAAKNIGVALAAAFGIRQLVQWGRRAISEATEAEASWTNLAGTIEATGGKFDELEPKLRLTAAAMQDATTIGDDQFAATLTRLITLTGDVGASTQNMGLVANVAAQFFKGELGPAADLVARVMNGQTTVLQRMGIQVKSAQEGLEVLAERSMGAAERRARQFGGRVQQLNNFIGDMFEALGNAVVGNEQASDAMGVLIGVVKQLTDWITENQDTLRRWVVNGIEAAITGVDGLYRAVRGIAEFFVGTFFVVLGGGTRGVLLLADGFSLAVRGAAWLADKIGADGLAGEMREFATSIDAATEGLKTWSEEALKTGVETIAEGAARFGRRAIPRLGALPTVGGTPGAPTGLGEPPGVTGGAEEAEKVAQSLNAGTEAFFAYQDAMRQTEELSRLLGDQFNALEAEASALETVIKALVAEGFDASSPVLQGFRNRLEEIRDATDQTSRAMAVQEAVAGELAQVLGAALSGGIGPAAAAKARQNVIEAAELGVRAFVSAWIPGLGWGAAARFGKAAAMHLAVAAAWRGLASAAGPGVMSAGVPSSVTGGGIGTSVLTSAQATRTTSTRASAVQPAAEVSVYLVGPGFDALNPKVQDVVYGAMTEISERYGNVTIRRVGP